ncbi:MAG: hypothetical protein DRP45_09715 [Candidatus Zixiibacteriota bacterium]|nr:MAG: hypothetical protein DRP45_09715 [candidate division Zixibacteria bacterium]
MPAEIEPGSDFQNRDFGDNKGKSPQLDFRTPAVCAISIDGKELKATVSSLVLTQPIDNHHILQIRIRQVGTQNSQQDIDDPAKFSGFLGSSVSVNIGPEGQVLKKAGQLDFIGIVTRVSLESQIDGLNSVLITAHSPTIAMDGARKNTLFVDNLPSDSISSVLRSNPLTVGTVDTAGEKQEYCVQFRETDYEFVMRLAGSVGLFAFYSGKEFHAVKASGSSPAELIWRETLGAFSIGLGTGMVNFDGAVWDPTKKEFLTGQKVRKDLPGAPSGLSTKSLDASDKVYGKSDSSFTTRAQTPIQSSIDKTALRDTEAAVGRMIECCGTSVDPAVGVGHCVKINGMGDIDGSYWVQKVTHYFDESGQYHNDFSCCPLDVAYPGIRSSRKSATHLHFTKVLDNNDPDNLGRVKVHVPWGTADETTWARVITPDAGADHGLYRIPDVDDEVLVGYDQGNPDRPVIIGSAYNSVDKPPLPNDECLADGTNFLKVFSTKSGNEIQFDDTEGKEQIHITQADGKTSITLTMEPGEPTVVIKSEGNISIGGDGNIAIESEGDMTLRAGGAMKIATDGGDIAIESGGALKQKASADIEVSAMANCKVKGTGNTDIEGTMVNVKGNGVVKVQGSVIQLN